MAKIVLVTIGTDGVVDFIQIPDGSKFNLGPISVLKLITGLVPVRTAKAALKEFLENKQVMLSVDLDKMWALLPFQRARYSSFHSSLMKDSDCDTVISFKKGADMDKNKTYYGFGKTASYDTFMANTEMAEDVITKVAATDETIDRLVSEGKQFDSARAKMDLHKLASRVSEISQNVDLAYPWVSNDLMELSKKANEIHELFHPKG